jgi:hypothetical protein
VSHERTVGQLMREMNHLTGFKVRLKQAGGGFYLEGPDGQRSSIGDIGYNSLLSPRDQEAICENLGFDAALLGLTPRED